MANQLFISLGLTGALYMNANDIFLPLHVLSNYNIINMQCMKRQYQLYGEELLRKCLN